MINTHRRRRENNHGDSSVLSYTEQLHLFYFFKEMVITFVKMDHVHYKFLKFWKIHPQIPSSENNHEANNIPCSSHKPQLCGIVEDKCLCYCRHLWLSRKTCFSPTPHILSRYSIASHAPVLHMKVSGPKQKVFNSKAICPDVTPLMEEKGNTKHDRDTSVPL